MKRWRLDMVFWGVVINSQTSAKALGLSTDGLLMPTATVKAMSVFRYFDYGRSAEFGHGKKGIRPRPV